MIDSSDVEKIDGKTTPHGPTARGKTHQGGNFKGTCTQRSVSPPATGHRSVDHRSTSHLPFALWTRIHFRTAAHRSLATRQIGITQGFSSQSITSHWPSSHQSLDLENNNTGEVSIHQTLVEPSDNKWR